MGGHEKRINYDIYSIKVFFLKGGHEERLNYDIYFALLLVFI